MFRIIARYGTVDQPDGACGRVRPAAHSPINDARNTCEAAVYSAAAANDGFMFADDTMKSEMRGTISDLKREPLKTP